MNHYKQLIKTLDAFIRRYYLNKLLRGSLLFAFGLAVIILLLSLSEYFLYLPPLAKISLLCLIGIGIVWVLTFWIISPLLKMQKIGTLISKEQAAVIIGDHFPEVKDKLLNILQLHQQRYPQESAELAIAGIEQKASKITVLPVLNAVNLKGNKRYLVWLLPALMVIGVIAFFAPQVFRQAAFRFSRPATKFIPPAPFQFVLKNKQLIIPTNENFTIQLHIKGEKRPYQVNLIIGNQSFLMQSKDKENFIYTLHNVQTNTNFHFEAAGYTSQNFTLKTLKAPLLQNLSLSITYPPYTGFKNESRSGFSNIKVPEGTRLVWHLTAQNASNIAAVSSKMKKAIMLKKDENKDSWEFPMMVAQDAQLYFVLSGRDLPNFDTLEYNITAIPDNPPQVSAHQDKDSISGRQILLTGTASDDYGIQNLLFHFKIRDKQNKIIRDSTIHILKPKNAQTLTYHYYFDINTFNLQPGQQLQYFVEAWDNDAVHGSKKGISQIFNYHQPDKKQLDKDIQENNATINQQIADSKNAAQNINQHLNKFRDQMLQQKGMSWEQRNHLKSLAEQQQTLQEQITALQKRFKMQQRQSLEKNYSESIRKKQEALSKQLDKVQNQDLAKLMKKLQQMLAEKNKDQTFQELQQWQQQNKLFQMDMERIKALMKKLTLQMKMEDLAQKAKALAESQEKLAQKTENLAQRQKQSGSKNNTNSAATDSIQKAQKELQKKLAELMKKDFANLEQANQQTSNPQNLSNTKEQGKQAGQQMRNSMNSMNGSKMQQAQQQQNQAASYLRQMSASLSQMAGGMEMKMLNINIKAVRQLLANLIRFSFTQEQLIHKENSSGFSLAALKSYSQKQHILEQNAAMIQDSLFSLSKRIFELAPTVNKETGSLNHHIDDALEQLGNRRIRQAQIAQQYAMTNANNLALMLDETLRHLMQMKMKSGQGSGSGKSGKGKPGKGQKGQSPGQMMKNIITGQLQMGKGLSEMKGNKGQQKPGQKGQNGKQNGGSEQEAEMLVRLAQQQARIRNMMQDLNTLLNSQGNGKNAQLIKAIQKAMNRTENDLVNRKLNAELMQRQQKIMTRLLRAQDAIRNQERENKRVAKTAKDIPAPIPPELKKIIQKRKTFLESYQTSPANLKPFYKKMSEAYRKQINGH